ncbi:MAG TPA: hypothetical protein V6C91_19660 [Coleofasciculaceae cyanobacterium]
MVLSAGCKVVNSPINYFNLSVLVAKGVNRTPADGFFYWGELQERESDRNP